ncbi:hypothetical protein PM3016_6783 [Paenibacillus mucilaginosus 3016]|uniref:Prepilin-type N-terminal cleavage/methylation domain-containing protein n=2 Tax=Paenibacillus mucilaginosus TaxID=61624 RepID=H6NPN3_9BACL|nr:type II secretion system protein [Paenibacillus mucilaginosus]AFC33389.1 hypothetical protein PM3016_6783 [Paenibacillus mucilaginosus 3016]AFH65699.1 hypothetical protein B2K_34210 [Paenibacillus mucilaginosus K02]WFA21799.1 type II secretion system protein [Paenibacillus mucilaginosus]
MMKSVLKRFKKEEKGFTLIELLAVIVILGIIAAIAVPMISGIINKSRKDADVATARQIYDATRLYITGELQGDVTRETDNTITLSDLTGKSYLNSGITLPSTKVVLDGNNTKVIFSNGVLSEVWLSTSSAAGAEPSKKYTPEEIQKSESTK